MRRLGTAALLLAVLPATVDAQYFGRNRVQYGRFDFRIIQTEHFDVHYYPAAREAALDIARMAERSYARLSRAFSHQFEERKPIIPYASHSEFQQTNTSGQEIDEGTGGFTDFLRHRNIFPLVGSYDENEHVLMHEMVHQFQFDIWSRGRGVGGVQGIINANAPLWFAEGMSEYFSIGPVDPNTAMWLRDAALEGKLPSPEAFYRVFPYRFGHALVAYIGQRWGDEAIGQITKSAVGLGGVEAILRNGQVNSASSTSRTRPETYCGAIASEPRRLRSFSTSPQSAQGAGWTSAPGSSRPGAVPDAGNPGITRGWHRSW
jgi:hypothetical protein